MDVPALRCLWVMGDLPLPARSGREVYSLGLLRAFAGTGAAIDVLCLGNAIPDDTEPNVRWHVVPARRRSRAASLLSRLPGMAYSESPNPFRKELEGLLADQGWDVVVIDHLQCGWAVPKVRRVLGREVGIVYASHNHETSVRREIARNSGNGWPMRKALSIDGRKVERLERQVVDSADLISVITVDDMKSFEAMAPNKACIHLGPGYDGPAVAERRIDSDVPRRAVILGTFTWRVKFDSLCAFLAVADDLFAESGVEIRIVGAVPEMESVKLAQRLRATTFVGVVPAVGPELAQARVGVIAERLGGGFKMKALDYVFNRVPVAILAGSAAGLPLQDGSSVLAFPDERSLSAGILRVIDDLDRLNSLQQMAFAACWGRFGWRERGESLRKAIELQQSGYAATKSVDIRRGAD